MWAQYHTLLTGVQPIQPQHGNHPQQEASGDHGTHPMVPGPSSRPAAWGPSDFRPALPSVRVMPRSEDVNSLGGPQANPFGHPTCWDNLQPPRIQQQPEPVQLGAADDAVNIPGQYEQLRYSFNDLMCGVVMYHLMHHAHVFQPGISQ